MRLLRAHIANFRGLEDVRVTFDRYHTLVGENGTGKTAILEAIRLATSTPLSQYRLCEQDFHNADLGHIRIEVDFDRYFVVKVEDGYASHALPCDGVELTVKRRSSASRGRALSEPYVVSQVCRPVLYDSPSALDATRLPRGLALDALSPAVARSDDVLAITRKNGTTRDLRAGSVSLSQDLVGYPNVFYFDRRREKETQQGFNTLFSKIVRELNWRYRKKLAQAATLKAWEDYYELTVGVVADPKKKRILEPVRRRLSSLLGVDYDTLEVSLLNLEQPFDSAFLALREGLNQVAIDGLGSGITAVFAYCLLEHISTLSREDLVFLIDEPELHLHPQIQQVLHREFIASPHQVVVTTHSPYFVDVGSWKSITRLDRWYTTYPEASTLDETLEGASIRSHLDHIGHWYADRTVFNAADPAILFARCVILVEGPVEQYGLPLLARLLEQDFGRATVVSCGGKTKIPHYVLLCRAFGVPHFVLFDLDGDRRDEAANARVLLYQDNAPGVAFSTSFEELLGIPANTRHKASSTLLHIDTMRATDVPVEIATAIDTCSKWTDNDHTPHSCTP